MCKMSRSASQTPNLSRKQVTKSNQGPVGAVDEDFFYGYFASIETKEVPSTKELQDIISDIIRTLKCHSEDWEKRMNGLKTLQSITMLASCHDDFVLHLRQLQVPIQSCLSDLRSQVVREACLTVAYMADVLKLRFEQSADTMMPHLIGLVPNSAKVIASSGMVCLSIIITNIQSPKLLLHVTTAMNSKSSVTRRFVYKLLETICNTWDLSVLTKQISNIEVALNKGLGDADQEVRSTCRSAFTGFASNFPQSAKKMLMTMDTSRRNQLDKELINHPINNLMSQSAIKTKRRTSCPPTPIKLGTRIVTNQNSQKKNYMSDSGDESVGSNTKNYLTRSRIKTQTNRPSPNVMSLSVNQNLGSSIMQTSTSSLSSRPYRTGIKTSATSLVTKVNNTKEPPVQRNDAEPTYLYKSSGSASATMIRRKIPIATTRTVNNSNHSNGQEPCNNNYAGRRRVESSDDNDSETSSLESSELSKSSFRTYKTTDNMTEILRQLSSSNWTDKQDGLINLQNLVPKTQLSQNDLKRIINVLNSLFLDTKSKIFHLLLGCVQQLIESHRQFLNDWLYILLLNLISKQATETMTIHQKPIQETLSTIRSQFPLDILVRDCCKIIGETYNNSSMKLKMSILAFFKTVLIVAPSASLERSLSCLTPTVNILIDWTFDSKWQEIRKISNALLLKFNDLHPQVLNTISQCLPPIARQKIYNLVKHTSEDDVNNKSKIRENYVYGKQPKKPLLSNVNSAMTHDDIDNYIKQNTEDIQALSGAYVRYDISETDGSYGRLKSYNIKSQITNAMKYEDSSSRNLGLGETVHANPGPSYMMNRFQSSLRDSDYHPLAVACPADMADHQSNLCMQRKLSVESLCYGIYSGYDNAPYNYYPPTMSGSTISDHVDVELMSSGGQYGVETTSATPIGLQMLRKISDLPPSDMVMTILSELCNLNQRTEQRKACLMKLIGLVRENSVDNWNELFKTTLMRLLETLKDNDPEIRCLSLRVIQELTKNVSSLFDNFTHLTVLKVLQSHKDHDKTVVRAAEECSQILARYLSQHLCIRVLAEIIKERDNQLNIGGLKMLLRVLKAIPESGLLASLNDLMPGLIYTAEHEESHIRKASIFCLVEIHCRIGTSIWPCLANLSSSKVRLLKLYIDKTKPSVTMAESMCI